MGSLLVNLGFVFVLAALGDAGSSIKPNPYDTTFLRHRSGKTLAELEDTNNTRARHIIDRIGSTFVLTFRCFYLLRHAHK